MSSPFDLSDTRAYAAWPEKKLGTAPSRLEEVLVEVGDPRHLTAAERARLLELNARTNMAIYAGKTGRDPDKEIPRRLGAHRDGDPSYIAALSAPDAMCIPARTDEHGVVRPEQGGPVFSVDAQGFLHMRYTARTVSIAWKDDEPTRAARLALERLLSAPTTWILKGRLEPGMGLVSNNVLHDRSGFTESATRRRLLYRARYYDRVAPAVG